MFPNAKHPESGKPKPIPQFFDGDVFVGSLKRLSTARDVFSELQLFLIGYEKSLSCKISLDSLCLFVRRYNTVKKRFLL
jgi:hypothetical protein